MPTSKIKKKISIVMPLAVIIYVNSKQRENILQDGERAASCVYIQPYDKDIKIYNTKYLRGSLSPFWTARLRHPIRQYMF